METNLHPETAAWGLLIGLWQRRFVDEWTVGEVIGWRQRLMIKGSKKPTPVTAKQGRHG